MARSSGEEKFSALLAPLRNWGRWGDDDQRGALNLIDESKVRGSLGVVRTGQRISLARPIPTEPSANNPRPASHFMQVRKQNVTGGAVDYLGIATHGTATTHLDALCHIWDDDGMWNGRSPADSIETDGAAWGGLQHWADGIVTRAVLIDVAASRPEGFVTLDRPVTDVELAELVDRLKIVITPGDALVIHSGRDRWELENGQLWGAVGENGPLDRPGLAPSCVTFFHDVDCSTLVWDMLDARPNDYGVHLGPHAAIYTQGMALIDNAQLGPLAEQCADQGRYDFLLIVAPLVFNGATGCAVNPLAIL